MAKFTADRFTHQDTGEYGQGKKVTTKILETDAKNTEYLLGEVERIDQLTPTIYTDTYAPFPVNTSGSTNITTTQIEKQRITDKKGITHRLQTQTIPRISGNNTTAHLESSIINITGDVRRIHVPIIETGTTTTSTSLITTQITETYTILGTLQAITGSSTGEVQPDSLLAEYHQDTGKAIWQSYESYEQFSRWYGQVDYDTGNLDINFAKWLQQKKHKTFYGYGTIYPEYSVTDIAYVRFEDSSTNLEYSIQENQIHVGALLTNPGTDTRKLKVVLRYNAPFTAKDGIIDLSKQIRKIIVENGQTDTDYPVSLGYYADSSTVQVRRNGVLLAQGVDYKFRGNNILVYSVDNGDILVVTSNPTDFPFENLRVVVDASREDTSSNMIVLPVQVEYTDE